MKYAFACLTALLLATGAMAQTADSTDISGNWYSVLDVGGKKLRINIELQKKDTGYTGNLYSPEQGNARMPLTSVWLHGDTLFYTVAAANISYRGIWDFRSSVYSGLFKQGGVGFPLFYGRDEKTVADIKQNRPQTPKPPFNYLSQEINFTNDSAKVTLAGTFSRPSRNKRYPAVIMISGSGPDDRDETMFEHKPFAVLGDQLTREGTAVLRFDDRGAGASTGNYGASDPYDMAGDVRAAIAYLRSRPDVDTNQIGLLGHSEGGMIAQIVAADNPQVAFVVLMAGPGVPGAEFMTKQNELVTRAMGYPEAAVAAQVNSMKPLFDIIYQEHDNKVAMARLGDTLRKQYAALSAEEKTKMPEAQFVSSKAMAVMTKEIRAIIRYNPAEYLPRIHCPVLAIGGTRDIQLEATQNLTGIEQGLRKGGNKNITIRKFEGLNHLFQQCRSCTAFEYGELEETISPAVVDFISNWVTLLPSLQATLHPQQTK